MAKKMIMTENYCDECDDVLHAVFDIDDFESHHRGSIMCKCGTVVMPCNECDDHGMCGDCPWKDSIATPAMSDVEYVKWIKENEPATWEILKDSYNGGVYAEVIRKLEEANDANDKASKPTECKEMWIVVFDEIDDDGHIGVVNRMAYDSIGEAVWAIEEDIEQYKSGLTSDNITIEEDEDNDMFEVYEDGKLMCRWAIRSVKIPMNANELN